MFTILISLDQNPDLISSISRHDTEETKGFVTQSEKLVDLITRNIHHIACAYDMLLITKAQACPTMQDIDPMIVCMLIQRGIAPRLDSKIAEMEMGRILLISNHNLACRVLSPAILWSIRTHRHVLPT
jgi:hypothetical protein